ncbi:hypothetical protein NHX12_031222, partial [Muraenolepis orangiensis]
ISGPPSAFEGSSRPAMDANVTEHNAVLGCPGKEVVGADSISELEEQVRGLREEVQVSRAQRKQQLAEVASLREEERRRDAEAHQASVARLRAEAERLRADAQKTHGQEMEAVREKVSQWADRSQPSAGRGRRTLRGAREENPPVDS